MRLHQGEYEKSTRSGAQRAPGVGGGFGSAGGESEEARRPIDQSAVTEATEGTRRVC